MKPMKQQAGLEAEMRLDGAHEFGFGDTEHAAMQGSGEFIHLVAFEHGLDHELGLTEEVIGCEGDLVHHFAAIGSEQGCVGVDPPFE